MKAFIDYMNENSGFLSLVLTCVSIQIALGSFFYSIYKDKKRKVEVNLSYLVNETNGKEYYFFIKNLGAPIYINYIRTIKGKHFFDTFPSNTEQFLPREACDKIWIESEDIKIMAGHLRESKKQIKLKTYISGKKKPIIQKLNIDFFSMEMELQENVD